MQSGRHTHTPHFRQVIKQKLELFTPFKNCKPFLDVEIVFEPVSEAVGEFEVTRSYFPLRHVRKLMTGVGVTGFLKLLLYLRLKLVRDHGQ